MATLESARNRYKYDWVKANRARRAEHVRRYRALLREQLLRAYGSICFDCGQARVLQIHHLDLRQDHRRSVGNTGVRVMEDLKRQGWPSIVVLLCKLCHEDRHHRIPFPTSFKSRGIEIDRKTLLTV